MVSILFLKKSRKRVRRPTKGCRLTVERGDFFLSNKRLVTRKALFDPDTAVASLSFLPLSSFPWGTSIIKLIFISAACSVCWVYLCCHNLPNFGIDYGIFIVRTDVNERDCTRWCTDTQRESALKVDSGKKIPCRTGESNLRQRHDLLSDALTN